MKRLRARIYDNLQGAHILLTSRVGAWRPNDDAALFEKLLPYTMNEVPDAPLGGVDHGDPFDDPDDGYDFMESEKSDEEGSPISYSALSTLSIEQMRIFACARNVKNVDDLIGAIERRDIVALASRPKDLDDIIQSRQ